MLRILSVVTALLAPIGATALNCDAYQASALALPEPWEAHTRTYSNGAIRVALLDLIEPAAGAITPWFELP
ncbi:hypothetical protein AIOL_000711 [Candidatus Rhodobacter oscarellae]|uniref:Uncharacterized protein n=1 Tax=Candidatus Rhodobacter oscarellae TaxID=1675527 RepID=A0A0J9EFT8_9RHOB|nr:hypothetical protein [Candidatus Rhodobacter lobularis]KMW60549.1 hypothetical protein AIOL_000711 [Candidatus Rhodobacter lobularis]